MAARRKKGSKPDYLVYVVVKKNGDFEYHLDDANGASAATIEPKVYQTVAWEVVEQVGRQFRRGPFQIEFTSFNPFGFAKHVLRSSGGPTKPVTVKFSPPAGVNRVFKYVVSTIKHWSDDPDVVPVPPDGRRLRAGTSSVVELSVTNDGDLYLTPDPASFIYGDVEWTWAHDADIRDDFTVTFDKYFPPLSSTGQKIVASFSKPADMTTSPYTIETNLSKLKVAGELTIRSTVRRRKAKKARQARKARGRGARRRS